MRSEVVVIDDAAAVDLVVDRAIWSLTVRFHLCSQVGRCRSLRLSALAALLLAGQDGLFNFEFLRKLARMASFHSHSL